MAEPGIARRALIAVLVEAEALGATAVHAESSAGGDRRPRPGR
ncbi:hypothetical protein [Geodermatophilus ruber]|nr:hypothetical protein [Geodermatophilus ruber]